MHAYFWACGSVVSMAVNVLLLGRKGFVLDEVERQITVPDISLHLGTSLQDVQDVMKEHPIDHVVMGAGIDLDLRCRIVEFIFQTSNDTTVHMKDRSSGPAGMMPFVNALLGALAVA